MRSISKLLGAEAATYSGSFVTSSAYRPSFLFHDSENHGAVREYLDYYHSICERGKYSMKEPMGTVYYDYKYFSESEINRSEYYDFLSRNNGKYAMGATIGLPRTSRGLCGIQQCAVHFSAKHGHPEAAKISVYEKLVPHLVRANLMRHQFGVTRNLVGELRSALDLIPSAIFGLTRDLTIKLLNSRAEQLLAVQDGVSTLRGKLRLLLPESQRRFADSILQFTDENSTPEGNHLLMPVERPSGKRSYILLATPAQLPAEYCDETLKNEVCFLVFVSDPASDLPGNPEYFGAAFGLTLAESRLALSMAEGASLKDYANKNRLSSETARWHLKNIFAKTDTRRQGELVRLFNSIILPVR